MAEAIEFGRLPILAFLWDETMNVWILFEFDYLSFQKDKMLTQKKRILVLARICNALTKDFGQQIMVIF